MNGRIALVGIGKQSDISRGLQAYFNMYVYGSNECQRTTKSIQLIMEHSKSRNRRSDSSETFRRQSVKPSFHRVYTELSNKNVVGYRYLKKTGIKQTKNEKPGCKAHAIHASVPSSRESSALQLQRLLRQSRKVHLLVSVLWHVFAGGNAVDCHLGVEFETAE